MAFYSLHSLAIAAFLFSAALGGTPGERELRRELFQDYDKYTRPVKKHTTAVPVKTALSPLSILDLNENSQILSMDSWVMLRWNDEYLNWNPADYDNIGDLRVSPSQIWKPDIALYTASPDTSLFPKIETDTIVYSNGTVLWVPPFTFSSRCPVPVQTNNVDPKPFVDCYIAMGSWTQSEELLDLQLASDEVDLSNFFDNNPNWKLYKIDSSREVKHYSCCTEGYPVLQYNITLKRRKY